MAAAGLPQPSYAEVQQRLAAASPVPDAKAAAEFRIENTPRQQEGRLSDPLEKIAALARAASSKDIYGRTKPGNRPGAGDWNDALEIAKQIDAEVARLSNIDIDLEADFADELAEVERRGALSHEMKQRLRDAQQTIKQRLQTFKQITNRINAAVRSGRSDEARAQLDALNEFLAPFDTARGAGPIDPNSIRAVLTKPTSREPGVDSKSLQSRLDVASAKSVAADGVPKAAGPTAADLAESDEVQLTAEIRALAAELDNSPTQIVEWVTNNIEYLPTYGAIQGAQLTLTTRRGNAFDTNALLVALLRAANIPARFVYGTIEVPEAQMRNWVGNATTALQAADVLTKGGIPTTILNSGGKPAALRIEHLWVEAYVDYVPSRGAVNREGDTWVPLDASFKQYTYAAPINYVRGANVPIEQILTSTFQTAERGPFGSITGIDFDYLETQIEANMDSMVANLQSVKPDANLDDILGKKTIVATTLPMLAGTLPYRTVATTNRYAALPNGLKHQFEVNFYRAPNDIAYDSPAFTHRIATVNLNQSPVYVKYAPASVTDEQGLAHYAEENAASLPLSMFRVIPELHIGDTVVQRGDATAMGTMQYWTVKMIDPSGASSQLIEPYRYAAGSHIAFVPNLAGITSEALGTKVAPLPQPSTLLPVHQALDLAGTQYWFLHDLNDRIAAAGYGGLGVRMPSVGAFAAPMNVRYFFGLPRTGYFNGYSADVKSVRLAASHTDQTKAARMVAQMGSSGSFAEGLTWDLLFGAPAGSSISAASIIAWANTAGVPIHTITRENIAQVMPLLRLSADAKSEISDAVNAGFLVVAPEEEFKSRGWSGSGYVLMDPATGGAIYRVEGGLNGGINVGCLARAIVLQVLCSSKLANLIEKILIRLAKRFAIMLGLSAILGPAAVVLPIIAAVWTTIEIIMAVNEIYRWVNDIIQGIQSLTPEELAELGIDAVNEALCNYMPMCFGTPFISDAVDWFGDGITDTVNYFAGQGGADGPGVGNPISTATGSKYQTETDYEGDGPYPLYLERRYVSYLPNGSIFGHKWRGNYDAMIRLAPGADPLARPDAALAVRPDGGLIQFNYRSGVYVANGDVSDTLVRIAGAGGETTGWRYRNILDEVETYDANGKLISIQERSGLKHTLTYNAQGRLEWVSDDFGRRLGFTYDATTGQVRTMTDPDNKTYEYEHNEYGSLVRVSYPDGKSRQYHYEIPGRGSLLTGITDERGVRYVSWKYDRRNRAIESSLANGAGTFRLSFGAGQTTVTDPYGTSRTYSFERIYDTLRLTAVSQPCATCSTGGVSSITYDGRGYPTSIKDFNGNVRTAQFNSRGLLESVTSAANSTADKQTTTIRWHSAWRLPVEMTQVAASTGSRIVRFDYHPSGLLKTRTEIADGASRTWTFTYNSHSQVTSVDGPRSDVDDGMTFAYDEATGNLTSERDANGLTTRYTKYDAHGRVLEREDANGLVYTYAYDARGRLTRFESGLRGTSPPEVTSWSYDGTANVRRTTWPDGSFVEYDHDDAGRMTGMTDSVGNRIVYTLNAAGDHVKEETFAPTGARVQVLAQAFSGLGRVEGIAASEATEITTYGYDPNGNQTWSQDPLHGSPSVYEYDALDRLVKLTEPTLGEIEYGYDQQNNLRRVVDQRNLVTSYDYSGFNDLKRIVSPDTGATEYSYDAAGNLSSSRDARGVIATHKYDGEDRPTEVRYPDEVVRYSYDEESGGPGRKGRLTTIQDSSGSTQYSYDADGRVTRKTQRLGATVDARVVQYSYGTGGLLETMTLPSGARIEYDYAADGEISGISVNDQSVIRQVEHFPFGEPKSWRHGASGSYTREYDDDGRVVRFTSGDRTEALEYDAASRITSLDAEGGGVADWSFEYDDSDRLTLAENAATAGPLAELKIGWMYDLTGNRTAETRSIGTSPSQTTPIGIDTQSNRLSSVGTATREYDEVGNTIRDGSRTYRYSARNRLVKVEEGSVQVADYKHNALGQRVCKALSGGLCPSSTAAGSDYRQFVYDTRGQLIGEYDAAGALVAEHVWLDDLLAFTLKPASDASAHGGLIAGNVAVYFVHNDHLGTPRAIVNASEQVVWRWESDPFGDAPANANPNGLGDFAFGLRFPGQYFDAETGTHYNYHRDYDPKTGRYLQSDPLGLEDGANTFAYARSNPIGAFDSDGLRCTKRIRQIFGSKRCSEMGPAPLPRKTPPNGGGIYKIKDCKGKLVYVGITSNFKRRMTQHAKPGGQLSAFKCCGKNPSVSFDEWETYDPAAAADNEAELIKEHKPVGNDKHNPNRKPRYKVKPRGKGGKGCC